MAIVAGRTLNDRYRLVRPVGQGSQASVWVAEHLALSTNVAVKLIDPELAKKESARERFRREATAAAQLRSAHVVQILDHGIDGTQPFIVMELLDGEDLFERLAHRNRLTLRETSKIVTQVARALTRAHAAGIVHRDLKPENVFLVPNEDDEVVKVLDFGVAKISNQGRTAMKATGMGTLIGTPHYMSPEQVKGIAEVDYRADLWALGVIAFQCLTGELPFDSEGVGDLLIKISIGDIPVPSKVYAGLPPAFDAWFARACERDPAKRFQSAREMALALANVAGGGEPVKAPTVRPAAKLAPTAPVAIPKPAGVPAAPAASGTPGAPPRSATPRSATPAPRPAYRPAWENKPLPKPPEPDEVEAIDDEEEDEAPTRMKPPKDDDLPPRPSTARKDPRREPDEDDIDVDEAETVQGRPVPAIARVVIPGPTPSTPRSTPAASPSAPRSPLPPSSPLIPEPAPSRPIAPVVSVPAALMERSTPAPKPPSSPAIPPPRNSAPAHAPAEALPEQGDAPPWATPAPTSAPAQAPAPAAPAAPPSPPSVTGLTRAGGTLTDPPPEFDGSRRRKMVRALLITLVLGAIGLTWVVVRSQLVGSAGEGPAESSSAPPVSTPPPPAPTPTPTTAASVVDPGKLTRPLKTAPLPSAKTWVKPKGVAPSKKPPDGTIEIPDVPGDVPPAP
ncbi:MAG: protein kinase [Byssovorax sp.]